MGKKPRCRIVLIDMDKKSSNVILDEFCYLGHPQIRPYDNNTILFCHEGPGNVIDARLWLINADGTKHRCAKPRVRNEVVTHEYWLSDGSKIVYVQREDFYGDVITIRMMDPDTLTEEVIVECVRCSHLTSNKDNSIIIGDGSEQTGMYLFKIDTKDKTVEKLCYHGSSYKNYGNSQDAHAHPAFSLDGKEVFFTSDMNGIPCVYKVEL